MKKLRTKTDAVVSIDNNGKVVDYSEYSIPFDDVKRVVESAIIDTRIIIEKALKDGKQITIHITSY